MGIRSSGNRLTRWLNEMPNNRENDFADTQMMTGEITRTVTKTELKDPANLNQVIGQTDKQYNINQATETSVNFTHNTQSRLQYPQ